MKRSVNLLWVLLVLLSLACRTLLPEQQSRTVTYPFSLPKQSTQSPTVLPPSPTPAPVPSAVPSPSPLPQVDTFSVRFHPDGPLYAGDLVSLEVIAPGGADLEGKQLQVTVEGSGDVLGPVEFRPFGIGGRLQATLQWAWNTAGLQPGSYPLQFSILPEGEIWTETVLLLPQDQAPDQEAQWAEMSAGHVVLHYITGTQAERDAQMLLEEANRQVEEIAARLQAEIKDPVHITLLPRVLGHGGFASDEIAVSYLERNYAGSDPLLVMHHEIVHLLDGRLGGELRPSMLVEGLAVYLSGGHFKEEPLLPRAAALLPAEARCPVGWVHGAVETMGLPCGLDRYIPLEELVDTFYASQHEAGYLQAGALIEFMVEAWGWDTFHAFYRDIHPIDGAQQSEAISAALQIHYGFDLAALEQQFMQALSQQKLDERWIEDVELTVSFYDTVRRYQSLLDRSAYFLTAWLPNAREMRERGIVADYLRRPAGAENLAVEHLLVEADSALQSGDYERVRQLVRMVHALLDVLAEPLQE